MICCWSKSLFQILLVMDPLEPFFLDFLTALRLLKKICAWQLQSYWYQNIYNNVNRFFFLLWRIFPFCASFIKTIPTSEASSRSLNITEKVAFNIASEASHVYILSGQKFSENAKNDQFWRVFAKTETFGQTVIPDKSFLIRYKSCQNGQNL